MNKKQKKIKTQKTRKEKINTKRNVDIHRSNNKQKRNPPIKLRVPFLVSVYNSNSQTKL